MSFSNAFENDLLLLLLNNTNIANLGDAGGVRGSVAAGSLYAALHTADPGEAGTQLTNEIAYGGYARVAVARSSAGWTVSGTTPTQGVNVAAITLPAAASGSGTATFLSLGRDASGAGEILWSGAITVPALGLAISTGITPSFAIGAFVVTID